ncbi:hypothetical protein H0H81_003847 [Sphagnurus paluster]|uniref:Uncharacterized protein n=1 Tax=Sphagnurus paluster TaxID=117069 RepID=A0A9P7GNY2_9AGAR|nr:hypothetical protein H0H81_003847 [Sphagnurus paluster]
MDKMQSTIFYQTLTDTSVIDAPATERSVFSRSPSPSCLHSGSDVPLFLHRVPGHPTTRTYYPSAPDTSPILGRYSNSLVPQLSPIASPAMLTLPPPPSPSRPSSRGRAPVWFGQPSASVRINRTPLPARSSESPPRLPVFIPPPRETPPPIAQNDSQRILLPLPLEFELSFYEDVDEVYDEGVYDGDDEDGDGDGGEEEMDADGETAKSGIGCWRGGELLGMMENYGSVECDGSHTQREDDVTKDINGYVGDFEDESIFDNELRAAVATFYAKSYIF